VRNVFKNIIMNIYFNLLFFFSVETWRGARRRRRIPRLGAVSAAAGPLKGPGRLPRHALW
jgi:hypothetical protein